MGLDEVAFIGEKTLISADNLEPATGVLPWIYYSLGSVLLLVPEDAEGALGLGDHDGELPLLGEDAELLEGGAFVWIDSQFIALLIHSQRHHGVKDRHDLIDRVWVCDWNWGEVWELLGLGRRELVGWGDDPALVGISVELPLADLCARVGFPSLDVEGPTAEGLEVASFSGPISFRDGFNFQEGARMLSGV